MSEAPVPTVAFAHLAWISLNEPNSDKKWACVNSEPQTILTEVAT